MKLLLDTHIWLWSVLEPERLSRRVTKEIQDSRNELWLSPISIWELIVLWQKKRMLPGEDLEAWIPNALRALPIQEAPVTNEVARETGRLRLPHRDPADRFLLATAKVFELTLVTADERLLKARDVSVLANR
ncbi:MAG TPA: type II toxin-antitoxin system VapC family toxin [Terriglobales bacterium]|jgi:PIN domain nuclease of toxin-antitoxin system|nr:type II toxin-antitoxin system VapC family toxin [Terriglobales bacterium]